MKASELRIKFLTFKHQAHQKLLEFLASPHAPLYLKVIGVVLAVLLFVLLVQILALIWSFIAYHRDPVSYLREYYDPLTPRYVDTTDFRTAEDHVIDLEAYKDELFKLNEFNTYLSDKIPINRKHKDPRSESCRIAAKRLPPDSDLASTSIVITFYNEELSTLLRTLVSIVLNSPMETVKEVILVDDKSSRDELKSRLDTEMAQFPFVKIIRNSKREGLMRSRIIGAKAAEGKILIFLDSHVEVLKGWYSPIVSRVMEDRRTVVCPVISTIDHTTLQYVNDKYTGIWGAWNWDMTFQWRPIPPREQQRRGFDDSAPIRTPAMAGGIFAVDREFFFEIGAYDPGMKVWGAENLEFSFRVWMCSGAIEINTCSFVGHIFRRSSVILQSVTGETALLQNTRRLVDVWLDEFKDAFFAAAPASKNAEGGDVISRVLLKQRLKCRSFSWYLREVFPDQPRPERDFVGFGQVKGPGETCLDTLGPGVGHQVGVYSCHGKGQSQLWMLMLSGELSNNNLCLDGDGENPRKVVMYECHGLKGNQQWFITEDNVVKHGGSGKCLTHDGRFLQLLPCDETDERFKWEFASTSDDVKRKFYTIYGKQFGYTTKAEQAIKDEEKKKRDEELAKRRAEEEKENARLEEERKEREAQEEASRKEQEEKDREVAAKEAAKRDKEEEEFRAWRAQKLKLEEEAKKRSEAEREERRRFQEEMKRNEEEKKRKEDEEREKKEREKEEEERRQFEEAKRLRELEEKKAEERRIAAEKEREREESESAENIVPDENQVKAEEEQDTDVEIEEDKLGDIEQNKTESEGNAKRTDDVEEDDDEEDLDMKEFLAWKASQKKKKSSS